MKLYYSPTSPFVRKVVLFADQLGLKDTLELVNTVVSPAEVNTDYQASNPMVQVPALETDDGLVISDSTAACDHIARLAGTRLFPKDGVARDKALQTHALANGATEASVQCAYEFLKRPEEKQWQTYMDGRLAKVKGALAALDQSDGSTFEVGDKLTYNQVVIACLLGYLDLRFPNINWRAHGKLEAFYNTVKDRPDMVETAPPA